MFEQLLWNGFSIDKKSIFGKIVYKFEKIIQFLM